MPASEGNSCKVKIYLPKDKHIGILIDPRSGSHALRDYVSTSLNILNLGEFLNPQVHQAQLKIDKNKKEIFRLRNEIDGKPRFEEFTKSFIDNWITERFTSLTEMLDINEFAIFSIFVKDVLSHYPNTVKQIKQRPDIFFIRLKRADVLYSIISIEISKHTNIWHNVDHTNTFSRENLKEKIKISLDDIKTHLERHINAETLVKDIFEEIPVIYYEQWQNNIRNLNNILNLPNKFTSIHYQKFVGNYKNLVSNIIEIEDYYREFVNKHSEHFPQFFNRLPDIKIPESQGQQPNHFYEFH